MKIIKMLLALVLIVNTCTLLTGCKSEEPTSPDVPEVPKDVVETAKDAADEAVCAAAKDAAGEAECAAAKAAKEADKAGNALKEIAK